MFKRRDKVRPIKMVCGDTVKYEIDVAYGIDKVDYELSEGDKLTFTMKKYIYDETPLIVKDISIEDCILEIASEDTIGLQFGEYHYNVQLTLANGEIYTVIADSPFIIKPRV